MTMEHAPFSEVHCPSPRSTVFALNAAGSRGARSSIPGEVDDCTTSLDVVHEAAAMGPPDREYEEGVMIPECPQVAPTIQILQSKISAGSSIVPIAAGPTPICRGQDHNEVFDLFGPNVDDPQNRPCCS